MKSVIILSICILAFVASFAAPRAGASGVRADRITSRAVSGSLAGGGSSKLVYADFETVKDGRPVSNGGGLIQLVGYQENQTLTSQVVGKAGSNPPAPELVHLKNGDPNHAATFIYQLLGQNQYAGAGIEIHAKPDVNGKATPIDISGYKDLTFELYVTGDDIARVDIENREGGGPQTGQFQPPPQAGFKVKQGLNTYRIPLKSFNIPPWAPIKIDPKDVFKKMTFLTIWVTCEKCVPTSGRVVVDNVVFEK